jgi:hypothetical protein
MCNWFAWPRLRQKSRHFLPDEADFFDRSGATVKKMGEVWREMGLFGPDSVPANQLPECKPPMNPIFSSISGCPIFTVLKIARTNGQQEQRLPEYG